MEELQYYIVQEVDSQELSRVGGLSAIVLSSVSELPLTRNRRIIFAPSIVASEKFDFEMALVKDRGLVDCSFVCIEKKTAAENIAELIECKLNLIVFDDLQTDLDQYFSKFNRDIAACNTRTHYYLWKFDRKKKIFFVEDRFALFFGGHSIIDEDAFLSMVFKRNRYSVEQFIRSLSAGNNSSCTFGIDNKAEANNTYWFRASVGYFEAGSCSGSFEDITRENELGYKLVEETNHYLKAKEHLRKIEKLTRIGTWKYNCRSKDISVSDGLLQLIDYRNTTDFTIDVFFEMIHPDDRSYIAGDVFSDLSAYSNTYIDFRIITKSMCTLYVRMQIFYTPLNKESLGVFEGTLQDITELSVHNHELETKNVQLKEINNNILYVNKQLEEAKKKAEESDLLKTEFLSNITHEIRTPISSISGFAELLRSPGLKAEQLERYVGLILQSNNRVLQIFSDMLDLSKLKSGQLRNEPIPTNIVDLLDELTHEFDSVCKAKGIAFGVRFKEDYSDRVLFVDCEKLFKVLQGIVRNAVKFSKEGAITINVSVGDKYLEIFVTDTGIGIPEEKLNQIFYPFRQASQGVGREHGGTGVGLSIVESLVELLDGEIQIDSQVGTGTSVKLTIPLGQNDQIEQAETEPKLIEHGDRYWNGKSLLVVEDNETNFLYLNELLKHRNINVCRVSNLADARKRLDSGLIFSAILLDVGLPDGSGIELLRYMNENSILCPVVIITSFDFAAFSEQLDDLSYHTLLSKPFTQYQLFKALDQIAEQQS